MSITRAKSFWFFFFFLLSLPFSNTYATTKNATTIKVACILDHGFFYLEGNGQLGGYNYDYMELISQHTGWELDFIVIENENTYAAYMEAIEMMNKGEIDLIGTVYRNESNEEIFEFPQTHTGISRYSLMSLANNYKITEDNYFMQDLLSVALVEGLAINDEFTALFDLRDLSYEITYVPSYAEALALLESEKVDTLLMTDTYHDIGKVRNLTTIDRLPFYFAAKKGNTSLIEELEQALADINVVDPDVHQRLLNEFFQENNSNDNQLILSQEETTALSEFDHFKVGLMENLPPYSSWNKETQEPSGIAYELLESLSEIIGIKFQYVWVQDLAELEAKIALEEIDFCGAMPAYHDIAHQLDVILSVPMVESGTLWLKRGGEVTDSAMVHMVSSNIPFYSLEDLTTVFDVKSAILDLSNHGTANIFCERNVAKYYLNQLEITNVDYQTVNNLSSDISLGMGKHLDIVIMGLLNNAVEKLDSMATEEIILNHMTFVKEFTLEDLIAKYKVQLNFFIILLLSAIVLVLMRHSKRLKILSQQDSMTKLINSGHFHQYAGDVTKNLKHGCLILIDIDLFKDVNDTYGHQKGDEVIQTVAQAIKGQFRQSDTVARLGGDEFAVLLETSCSKPDLEKKFKNLLEQLAENKTGVPVTLSIGGYIFSEAIKYQDLYDLADQNLYKVKENGRNSYLFSE